MSVDDTSQHSSTALTTINSENTDVLRATDQHAARAVAAKACEYRNTDIDDVRVRRFGERIDVQLRGRIALGDAVEYALPSPYAVESFMAHSTGDVTVTLERCD